MRALCGAQVWRLQGPMKIDRKIDLHSCRSDPCSRSSRPTLTSVHSPLPPHALVPPFRPTHQIRGSVLRLLVCRHNQLCAAAGVCVCVCLDLSLSLSHTHTLSLSPPFLPLARARALSLASALSLPLPRSSTLSLTFQCVTLVIDII